MGKMGSLGPFMIMVLLVLTMVGAWEGRVARAQAEKTSGCKEERRLLVNECAPVVSGLPPSSSCCERIKVTRIECVCPVVTPSLAALIGVDRALKIIQGCGRLVPKHFQCGSNYSVNDGLIHTDTHVSTLEV